jgi:Raf kinase inhibitor-like YbhB/YbcL family protein
MPAGTKELALVVDDPDAPRPKPWVHWVLYGLPPTPAELKERHAGAGIEGPNDFGKTAWGGPMPPPGHGVHRYYFRLYALKEPLNAVPGWDKETLLSKVKGRVLQVAELMGTYERK